MSTLHITWHCSRVTLLYAFALNSLRLLLLRDLCIDLVNDLTHVHALRLRELWAAPQTCSDAAMDRLRLVGEAVHIPVPTYVH